MPNNFGRFCQERLGLREDLAVEVVEPAGDLSGELYVRGLVEPYRDHVCHIHYYVRGLEHRVAEETVGGEVAVSLTSESCSLCVGFLSSHESGVIIESSTESSACSFIALWTKTVLFAGSMPTA